MRTDCYVEQKEVVAFVLEDVASAITASCEEVKRCIESERLGWTKRVGKDFLTASATTTKISRGAQSVKRKCCTVRLDTLPSDLKAKLKHGIHNTL